MHTSADAANQYKDELFVGF